MPKKDQKPYLRTMKTPVYIISLLFLFLHSCTQHEQKFQKSELIPAKDLVPVLYDLHLADGLLSISEIRKDYNDMDSLGQYVSILESYGYSLEQLNNTIEYYSSDPETLNEIYEKVITQLSETEMEIISSDTSSITQKTRATGKYISR